MISFIYWHPKIYNLFLRILHGKHFKERYQKVAECIPVGSTVADICCGDCHLYKEFLCKKGIYYVGLDANPLFVKWGKRDRIPIHLFDVLKEEIPPAEYVIMMGSLYHFMPWHKEVVDKMLKAATKKVIITEGVRTFTGSSNRLISFLAKRLANPGTKRPIHRFNEKMFIKFLEKYGSRIEGCYKIAGGRQMLAILKVGKLGKEIP